MEITTVTAAEVAEVILPTFYTLCSRVDAVNVAWLELGTYVRSGQPFPAGDETVVITEAAWIAGAMAFIAAE